MKLAAIVLLAASLRPESAGPGLQAPANPKQTSAAGKSAYPEQVPAYGSGRKARDVGYGACNTSSKTAAGQADDWCLDKWGIVDLNSCDIRNLGVSTQQPSITSPMMHAMQTLLVMDGSVGARIAMPRSPKVAAPVEARTAASASQGQPSGSR